MLNIPRLDYRGNFQSLFNFEGLIDSQERGISVIKEYGGVAQLGEHLLCKQGVIGSIPFISTKVRYREANRTSARFHFVKLATLRKLSNKKFDEVELRKQNSSEFCLSVH